MKKYSMALFRNKYRVESARLPGWDYSNPGHYFVTICTYDHGNLFGIIDKGVMTCNKYGRIVHDEWQITGNKHNHFRLDEFMVMPNHMHAIIQIVHRDDKCRDVARNVSTRTMTTTTGIPGTATAVRPQNEKMAAISPMSGSLPVFIRSFKSAVTKRINEIRGTPGGPVLQYRFHDHIIRNPDELLRIRQYIRNNPANWGKDKFNTSGNNSVREVGIEYEQEIWMV